jgi:GTPase SAR1 family protein
MAENTPTFKLVLVGDGGTGKVRISTSAVLREDYGAMFESSID